MASCDDPWSTLQKNFVALSEKLDLNDAFVGILYQEGFIDRRHCERLRSPSSSSTEERDNNVNLLLLEILPRQSNARFSVFCNCLRQSSQEHLADILEYGEERVDDSTSGAGLHQLKRPPVAAQSSDSSDSLSILHSVKSLNISAVSQNQSASFQIGSPCTSIPPTSTPVQDIESTALRLSYGHGSHQNLPSDRYGSGSSISSFQQVSRGQSIPGSGQLSGLQNHSGASSTSSFHRLSRGQSGSSHFSGLNQSGSKSHSVDGRGLTSIDQGLPISMPTESPEMGERIHKCSFCSLSHKKVAYYRKDLESKIDQIVLLEEKLNEKDEYCYNLEDTVAELTHRSRGMEQANSDLIARLQSTPARSTSGIPDKPLEWTVCKSEKSSDSQNSTASSALQELTAQEHLRILHMSIQHWFATHGTNATADQLYSAIASCGNKQLADSLFQQATQH